MPEQPTLSPLNLHEYEEAARAVLPRMVYEYVAAGADDEVTLRENRAAFGRRRLLPRVMRGIEGIDLRTTVLGQEVSLPVLLAPVVVNIVAFHALVVKSGLGLPLFIVALLGALAWQHRDAYRPLLTLKKSRTAERRDALVTA